jgi:serine/threonine-protein kinase
MTLEAGSKLGRYEIRSKIGAGGMGDVYLAQDTALDRKVALKILPAEVAGDRQRMQRFTQEAKAASALNHPNILTIHEIGESGSDQTVKQEVVRYIATEYVEGITLRDRLARPDVLTLSEALDISVQVAAALAAAHTAGIVHRDIKPDNLMLRNDGLAKVLDFGLAKLAEPVGSAIDFDAETRTRLTTQPGMIMGTAAYMSPEQARGLDVDARTDIFSFGVVLYEIIAGCVPFTGASPSEAMASILSDKDAQPLARYSRDVPSELERIVSKALRKNRDERYQTIKDMLLDLKGLKQEVEFEKQLARSAPLPGEAGAPASRVTGPAVRGLPSRSNTHDGSVAAGSPPAAPASIGRYIVSGISRHKHGAALGLLVVFLAVGIGYWSFFRRSSDVTVIDSIAVMPFENVTRDQNTEYLSDGVTESLINSLSQMPQIKVIGRNSVFRYKHQTPDLQQVARQLNVQAVLTGRILGQGDTLSVSVELTEAQSSRQLWGERYTRKASEIFAVQDEIARHVTDTLRVRLTGVQQGQVTKRYTNSAEAYRLYLQGRYFMNEFSEENLNRAISFFDQAIELDPRYALAYAARGESFFAMGDLSLHMSEAKLKAKQDVEAALRIDETLVEARTTLANIKFQYDWDFTGAEADFRQAIALNPNYAEGHHQYAWYLAMTGKPMAGLAEMRLAQQLDPVNPSINVDVCLPYYLARQFDESIAQARKALEMFPNFYLSHMTLGLSLFQKGDYQAGIEELQKAKATEATPHLIGAVGYAYARSGRKDEARKMLAGLKELSIRRYVAPYWIAMIYVGLGDNDEAVTWLEKAYQERSWWLIFIKMDPMVDSLRSDARFIDLMRRIGFPQR